MRCAAPIYEKSAFIFKKHARINIRWSIIDPGGSFEYCRVHPLDPCATSTGGTVSSRRAVPASSIRPR